jgi:4-amino-4-deoxy-L-arabinose transferase-like glycosyltransferase
LWKKKFLTLLFILALAIRLIYVLFFAGSYLAQDSGDWIANAQLLISDHTYGDSWRPPLYSFYLALVFLLFGQSLLAVCVAQALLGAATCLLVYYIGRTVFNKKVGLIGACLCSFYPYFIYYTGDVMAETMLTFLLSGSLACLIYFQEGPTYKRAMLAGLCLGLTSLCKPVILPFVILLPGWGIIVYRRQIRQVLPKIIIILTATILVILPWSIRNYLYYHEFCLISTGGAAFWFSYNPLTIKLEKLPELLSLQDQNQHSLSNDFEYYPRQRYAEISKLPRMEADKVFMQEAWDFIKNNPKTVVWLWYKRFFHFWRLYPLVATPANKMVAFLTSGFVIIFGWLGLLISFRHWRKTLIFLFLFGTYTFVYMISLTNIRYRIPIDACLMVFAAYTLWWLYQRVRRHENER